MTKASAVLALFLLATLAPSAHAICPNEAIREAQGPAVLALPDCMALEQVSPTEKANQLARAPQAVAADGRRIVFNSFAALDPEVPISNGLGGDLFVATRQESSGWATKGANLPYGSAGSVSGRAQSSFTPDLSHGLQSVKGPDGFDKFVLAGLDHTFTVLSPPLRDATDAFNFSPEFQGVSGDQSHVYFRPSLRGGYFTPGDPQPSGEGEDYNLYVSHLDELGEPVLELAALDLNGKVWGGNCGARLGGIEATGGTNLNLSNGIRNQGAISADGTRAYFSTRPDQPAVAACSETHKKRIMVREETPSGPVISGLFASECDRLAPACSAAAGDDAYQGASLDQTKVYFTSTRQLADTDLDTGGPACDISAAILGCDLYLYDSEKPAGEQLTQVSAGEPTNPTPGAGANLYNSIAAISADGSRVYFAAQGVLTTDPNPEGASALAGQPNLYTWEAESGDTAFIGTLAANDGNSGLWGANGTWSNGAYPVPINDPDGLPGGGDGHILLLKSNAPLTADDADGGFRDVFRYDAEAGTLLRISKGEPGGSDNGAFNASPVFGGSGALAAPGSDYAERGRPISEDGETIEFTTTEGLGAGDPSGAEGVYLWRGGQVHRLPGSTQVPNTPGNSSALSADGSTLAYHTTVQLLPSDGDTALDVYVARVNGGYPVPPPPRICQVDEDPLGPEECQPRPPLRPENPPGESVMPQGNLLPQKPGCPKGKVRRQGKCVKKQGKKKHGRHKQRANHNRGGAK